MVSQSPGWDCGSEMCWGQSDCMLCAGPCIKGDWGDWPGVLGGLCGGYGHCPGVMGVGLGVMGIGLGVMGVGLWVMGIGLGVMEVGLGVMEVGLGVMEVGLGVIGDGLWVMGVGLGVMGVGLGVMGVGLGVYGGWPGGLWGLACGLWGLAWGLGALALGLRALGKSVFSQTKSNLCFSTCMSFLWGVGGVPAVQPSANYAHGYNKIIEHSVLSTYGMIVWYNCTGINTARVVDFVKFAFFRKFISNKNVSCRKNSADSQYNISYKYWNWGPIWRHNMLGLLQGDVILYRGLTTPNP